MTSETFDEIFCSTSPMNPYSNLPEMPRFVYSENIFVPLYSIYPTLQQNIKTANIVSAVVMLATVIAQALLLNKARNIKRSIKTVNQDIDEVEEPTYCELAVVVITSLQVCLGLGLLLSICRLIFMAMGDYFSVFAYQDCFWFFYMY